MNGGAIARTTGRRTDRRRSEGSIAPLIVGFFVVIALLVAVVVDASAAYLRRESLNALADATALAATEGLQGEVLYLHGLGPRARIDPVAAGRYASSYLHDSGALSRLPGLTFSVETDVDTVTVRLRSPLRLPLRMPGIADQVQVSGSASAAVAVRR